MPAAAARAGGMRRRAVVMRERGVGVGVGGRKAALAMGEVAKGREDEREVFCYLIRSRLFLNSSLSLAVPSFHFSERLPVHLHPLYLKCTVNIF